MMARLRRFGVLLFLAVLISPVLFDWSGPATAQDAATPVDVHVAGAPVETATSTPTSTPTNTPTQTATNSPTSTSTSTATRTSTATQTSTVAPTRTPTPAPRISLSVTEGNVGASVRVELRYFAAGKRVAIRWDGTRVITIETDENGKARGSITIPAATAGGHEISADGSGKSASKTFVVVPRIVLSPTSVQQGKSFTVTLTGFAANSSTKVRLYDLNNTSVVSVWQLATNELGSASGSVTTKGATKPGSHQVIAVDAAHNSAQTTEQIKAAPTPTPTPTKTSTPRATATSRPSCDPNYPTICVHPYPPDLDCTQIPYKNFSVPGADPHGFDRDHDGIGCET